MPAKTVEGSNQVPRPPQHFTCSIEKTPEDVVDQCLSAYSLQAVFGRDLAAAHDNALLRLSGLNYPRYLETVVVDPPSTSAPVSPWKLAWAQVRDASMQAGAFLVVDGADLLLAAHGRDWLDGFCAALEAHGRGAVFHVQTAAPPGWASELDSGPLFTTVGAAVPALPMSPVDVAALLDAVAFERRHALRIAWHIQAKNIDEPTVRQSLEPVLARTEVFPKSMFVFDRQRQNVRLHEGIDRKHPAVLLRIHLLLHSFLQLPEIGGDATRMLAKLPSLLRMAVSAGVQKRNYHRRHSPELTRGFLLERARLIVVPWLLDVVGAVTGALPAQSKLALDFARQILQTLREAADREGRNAGMDVVLTDSEGVSMTELVLTKAEIGAQQSAASALLEIVHDGCFRVSGRQLTTDAMWQYLRWAAKTAHIPRIRFIPLPDQPD